MQVRITTLDNLVHTLNLLEDQTPDYNSYTTSINTKMALEAAYNAGRFELFEPPAEPDPNAEPDWLGFQVAIATNPAYQQWINAVASINYAVADAIPNSVSQRQIEVTQQFLQAALELVPMPIEAAQGLQQIINDYNIPLSLV